MFASCDANDSLYEKRTENSSVSAIPSVHPVPSPINSIHQKTESYCFTMMKTVELLLAIQR